MTSIGLLLSFHELAQQLHAAFNAFVGAEARNLDMVVVKYFYLYALAGECDSQSDTIRAVLSLQKNNAGVPRRVAGRLRK
jgi:hypothetical protein